MDLFFNVGKLEIGGVIESIPICVKPDDMMSGNSLTIPVTVTFGIITPHGAVL